MRRTRRDGRNSEEDFGEAEENVNPGKAVQGEKLFSCLCPTPSLPVPASNQMLKSIRQKAPFPLAHHPASQPATN